MALKLKRGLRFLEVFCIATGAMISSGLFILPGLAHAKAGPAVAVSYLIAGLLATFGMLSQAELVSAMPRAGGTYFYVARSMGPALGTIDGLLTWVSISLKSSFALVGMAAFARVLLDVSPELIALTFCVIFIILNLIGIKEAGRVQVGLVFFLMVLIAVYVWRGIPVMDTANFRPFAPYGPGAVFSTAGFIFISYGGLLKVASIAEEVKRPATTVPTGMILSLLSVSVLYTVVVTVTSGVLGAEQLDNSLTPISDGARVFMGDAGPVIMSIAAVLAFISTANAGIMAASRYPLALSRDNLLPEGIGRIHSRFKTPVTAILLTGTIMSMAIFLDLSVLVKVASTVLIVTFMFSSVCVIIMRESGVKNYRPIFTSPMYPWVQLAGIFGGWLLVVSMGQQALIIASVFFAVGLGVFWVYGRERAKKDYALLHLVERMASKDLVDISLEAELKEIIKERIDSGKDRFDRIIEESVVIDVGGPVNRDEFFYRAARELSVKLGFDVDEMMKRLLEREEQGSTVVSPGIAIPHLVVDGKHGFAILIARSREGIIFPEAEEKVHMVFVIAGTRDEKAFHLRALSAIAQIVDDKRFKDKWLSAETTEELRSLILEGDRKRK